MTDATPASSPSTVRLMHRQTTRTARFAVIGAEQASATRIWFALHGYGQLAERFLRPFEGIVPDDTCIVAPEGLSRFYLESPRADGGHMQRVGATWLTREGRDGEIADALRWLDQLHDEVVGAATRSTGAAPWVGVLGFSQGVATAARWIAHGHVAPAHFVAWAGGLAHDVDALVLRQKLSASLFTLVAGTRDQFATAEAREKVAASARELHQAPREIVFDGAHHLDGTVLQALLTEQSVRD